MWDLWWTERHWGRFPPSTSVSLSTHSFHQPLHNHHHLSRKVSSGMLRRVALVRTDVSEEPGASFIRVTRIGELGRTQVATSNRRTLRKNTMCVVPSSSMDGGETSLRNVGSYKSYMASYFRIRILHSHRRESIKSYIALTGWTL
jgi:hypothetical protein